MSKTSSDNRKTGSGSVREWIQVSIIAFAAIFGAWEFILKDIVQPAQKPTALEISARLEQVGERDNGLLIKATVAAYNPTDRRIYVPAFYYIVWGYHLYRSPQSGIAHKKSEFDRPHDDFLVSAFGSYDTIECVAQKCIVHQDLSWWEPQDKTHEEALFVIPAGKFDYLEMRLEYFQTRDDSRLGTTHWETDEDGIWSYRIMLKRGGNQPDQEFDYFNNSDHKDWAEHTAAGSNWYFTTLSLWDEGR